MEAEFARSPEVQDWQWRIAATMRRGIESSFGTRPDEIDCVQAIVEAVGGAPAVAGRLRLRDSFKLEVESAFLHGPRSQVRFHIGGTEYQRELADLLVLATYVEDGTLAFQRACFIQAKRSGASSRSAARFSIDPWQLALLGSFPEFTGFVGAFRGLTLELRNRSGMLGAYGLLSPPGEFTVVSARVLSHVLGGRHSLTTKELIPAILSETGAMRSAVASRGEYWWFDPEHCPYCHELAMHKFPHHWLRHHGSHASRHTAPLDAPVESVLTCVGLDEFAQSWTGLRLGEIWQARSPTGSDRALRQCLRRVVRRAAQIKGALSRLDALLAEAGGDHNLPVEIDGGDREPSGLGVLSVVGTVSRGE